MMLRGSLGGALMDRGITVYGKPLRVVLESSERKTAG